MTDRPVHWIALGGTIQAVGADPLDTERYHLTGRSLAARDLLAQLGPIAGPVVIDEWGSKPSHDYDLLDLLALLTHIRTLTDATAVVISCGSNGLEELAYFIWLLHGGPVPVVLTSSLWPPSAIGSDAQRNLLDAILLARTLGPATPGRVLIASDNAVLHPVDAYKAHTTDRDAFSRSAPGRHPRRVVSLWSGRELTTPLPRVDVIYSCLGADGLLISGAADAGAAGIVLAGMGAGFVTAGERAAVAECVRRGIAICQSRRTPAGAVTSAARDSLGLDVLLGGALTPQKARVALIVGIGLGAPHEEIQRVIDLAVAPPPD